MKTNSAVLSLLLLGSSSNKNEAQALQLQNLEQENFVMDEQEAAESDRIHKMQVDQDKRQKELVELLQKESEMPIKPFEEEKQEAKAAQKPRNTMATVPLRNIQNQQYVGDVFIGNPPQRMTVQFDTGSAIVYVLTDKCNEHCNNLPKYQSLVKGKKNEDYLNTSAMSDDLMNRVEYGYGSGYINGFAQEAQICFSEDPNAAPCVKGVKMLQADQATGVDQDRFAGIIGLGPRSSESKLRAFILQLQDINEFSKDGVQLDPKFSVYLSKDPSQNGDITFGGYDVKQYAKAGATDADIFWGQINPSEKYWTLTMDDIGFNDKKNGGTSISGATAKNVIIDTGVSYAIIPTKDFLAIEEGLKKYGVECKEPANSSLTSTHTCKCDKYEELPDITINVKNSTKEDAKTKRFVLPKESYMELKDGGCHTMRLTPSSETWGLSSQGYWVMGDIFLQNYYSIYDFPNHRMGLIESKDFGTFSDGWNQQAAPSEAKVQVDWGQEFEGALNQ